jgi:UDP-N-acetylmuramate dehydrogenase
MEPTRRRHGSGTAGGSGRGAVERAAAELGELAERDVPLAPYTTYKLGGPAALFVRATSSEHLRRVAAARAASGLPVLVVGKGSNLLVADGGFSGIAVYTQALGGDFEVARDVDAGPPGRATIGAGMSLPVVARRLAGAGWRGLEWAVGVPGSVGGAVRMNAGGHGSDIAECVRGAEVFDLASGEERRWAPAELGLRFRASALTDDHVVVRAEMAVTAGERAAAEAELADIVRWRREHQPGGQNAGSVFVNPVPGEVSAGSLIDALGLRGLRHGTAHVSEKHANFIQGGEGGSADDVRALIEIVRAKVADSTGYVLRSEVRLVGFDGGTA